MSKRTPILDTALAVTFTIAGVSAVHAQEVERPLRWHLDAGYSWTTGTTEDFLDDGWMLGFGATWRPQPGQPWAIRADLNYSAYDATDNLINIVQSTSRVRIDDGDAYVVGLDLNGVFDRKLGERALGFATAGIGVAYRDVEMTQTVLVGGIFCDPWWGICYPGVVPGDAVVADQSTTKFSWNVGLGVEIPMSYGGSWFVEAGYRRIETSEPTEFIPLQIGFRF